MPPKTKTRKVATTVTKKKGNAAKRKSQHLDLLADPEWISGDEEEPSIRSMMSNMGALLSTLNSRMEGFERWQDHMDGTAASHTVFTAPPGPSTCQIPEEQAAPPRLMTAEMRAPLTDVADKVRV